MAVLPPPKFLKSKQSLDDKLDVRFAEDPIETVRKRYDELLSYIIVVMFLTVITMFLMVAGMLFDSWNAKTSSYNEMTQRMDIINSQIQQLQTKSK
jgi:hypothetical protein